MICYTPSFRLAQLWVWHLCYLKCLLLIINFSAIYFGDIVLIVCFVSYHESVFYISQICLKSCLVWLLIGALSCYKVHHMNFSAWKRTFWQENLTNTKINLRKRAVWSKSLLSAWRNFASLAILECVQRRFWSDCANAQVDQNLRWAHMSKGTFSDFAVDTRFLLRFCIAGILTSRLISLIL